MGFLKRLTPKLIPTVVQRLQFYRLFTFDGGNSMRSLISIRNLVVTAALFVLPSLAQAQSACPYSVAYASPRQAVGSTNSCVCGPLYQTGSIYGTGTYTDDSHICSAAVHNGSISAQTGGVVTYVVNGVQKSYEGKNQNGIQSIAWGAYGNSFTLASGPRTPPPPLSCTFQDQSIPAGSSVIAFEQPTASYGQSCIPQTRVCGANGVLSGTAQYSSCAQELPKSCKYDGVTYAHGSTIKSTTSQPSGGVCIRVNLSCNNGVVAESKQALSCPSAPVTCTYNGEKYPVGASITLFKQSILGYGDSCDRVKETRVCGTNGVFSGTSTFGSCQVLPLSDCPLAPSVDWPREGRSFICSCGPIDSGVVINGTGIYRMDSHICSAARHAGRISAQGGTVKYTILGPQYSFTGSVSNGITSEPYGYWSASYQFNDVP